MNSKKINIGHFEAQLSNQNLRNESVLSVSGWLIFDLVEIHSLELLLNGKYLGELSYGYPRADVNEIYPGNLNSGFQGIFNIDISRKKSKLTILIVMSDGSRLEALHYSLIIVDKKIKLDFKKNLVILWGGAHKAWLAFKGGRLTLSPGSWLKKFKNYRVQSLSILNNLSYRDHIKYSLNNLIGDPYAVFRQTNRITEKLKKILTLRSQEIVENAPLISILTPIYNTPHQFLKEMIESVLAQIYPKWELCLIDDASSDPIIKQIIEQYAEGEPRIKVVYRMINGNIAKASNDALGISSGEYIALLDHDDLLAPDALLHFADSLVRNPNLDWLYSDEDKVSEGVFYDPLFKGGWSPEMALTHNFTHHLSVIRKDLVLRVGGFRSAYDGVQDLDLFLRIAEITSTEKIKHIPFICYHWRAHDQSTALNGGQKEYIFERASSCIDNALKRRDLEAISFLPKLMRSRNHCLYQLEWSKEILAKNPVTIIIPTRDKVELLRRCISSLQKTVDHRHIKIIVVNDNSELEETGVYFKELLKSSIFDIQIINVVDRLGFNYSRLVNIGVHHVTTDLVLHLNNDVEAINPGWIEDMVGWITIQKVGVVGAKLIYPDNKIQHAGVVVGPHGGLADHLFHGQDSDDAGYAVLLNAARNVSAVTGACLLTKTELYRRLNGFDEDNFAVEYNDVDYCLRVIAAGERVVYTPQAKLIHLTSASRGNEFNPQEHINFVRKYDNYRDQYFSKSLDIEDMSMGLNYSHYLYKNYSPKLKILFLSHNLSLGGAPIVMFELAKNFINNFGCDVTIISPKNGQLKSLIEKFGIKIQIIEDFPDVNAISAHELQEYLVQSGCRLNVKSYDLLVTNTLVAFWGVQLAKINRIPVIWHIHESTNLAEYIKQFSQRSMHEMFNKSFINANRVIFQSDITRSLYSNLNIKNNFSTINGGLQLQLINSWRKTNSKYVLRKKYRLENDHVIISIIGTTCERKGQIVFLNAIEEFNKINRSDKNITFLIVGGIPGAYLNMLESKIRKSHINNVRIFSETIEIYDFFQLSDVFVCASFVESFPMVVLLAMAFELPVISTNVFGIPEIITDSLEGRLFNPGNSLELAKILNDYFLFPNKFKIMANKALAKCWRLFDSNKLSEKHFEITLMEAMKGSGNEA